MANQKSGSIPAVVSLLCVLLTAQGYGQVRGQQLFDLLSRGEVVQTKGSSRVTWLPGGMGYLEREADSAGASIFYATRPETGEKTQLFATELTAALIAQFNQVSGKAAQGLPFSRFEYVLSGNGLLFTVEQTDYLFDLSTRSLRQLRRPRVEPQPGSQDLMRNMRSSQLWNGKYSADYKYFAYVKNYDLYLVDTRTGEERPLTRGGNENIFNGRPDWVYPEEFGQLTAYWWSPNSRMVAYYQFDETAVHKYPLVHDLKPEAELELQSYPKAGETNPTVKLFVIDIETGKEVEIQTGSTGENYIVRPKWLHDSSELTFQRLNRHQSHLELFAADPTTGTVRKILEEKEPAFVNLNDDFILLQDGERFLWTSERSGWLQIYLYDLQGNLLQQLTEGTDPVSRIVAIDEQQGWVYFTANTEMGLETHFFRVRLDGTQLTQLTHEPGSHRISMDPACRYYIDSYSSFTVPPTAAIHAADGKKLRTILTTDVSKLDSLALEPPELVIVKAADETTDLHGLLFKPAGFSSSKHYPLLVSVYGGPHSKSVRNSYQMVGRLQAIAQLGYMVWTMDNRGLRNRGKKFETETYLKLGQVDLADQTAGVRQICQRPYIDCSRVGVFGGSYGGYMTCLALLKEPEIFHVGVASAPVTDWRNYDTIYTERYMRTPQENKEGYDLGSALPFAGNLQGKLLLIHGSVDNNVHPGNTIQLIQKLVEAGKNFDLMIYPEQRHGIRGPGRQHSQRLMLEYFRRHLRPEPVEQTM